MRLQLSLLLAFAAVFAAEASVRPSYASRQMLDQTCPIQFCNSGRDCVYASRTKKWTCKACIAPRTPNTARNECVCPAGMFPTAGGGCSECKMNMFCPRGQSALRSTAQACPANMVTLRRGAKNINECFNAPGYYYRKTSGGVRAIPCPVDTWTTGLKKQTVCTACLTGFKTDPETVPGSFTSSDVCVAPAGSFVTGTTVTLCPKGEYSDEYSMATSCQTCEEKYGTGITTPKEGSTAASDCFHLEPGFVLVDDKNKAFLTPIDLINTPYVGAKPCPQNYYCPGGDPTLPKENAASGVPRACPHKQWTEAEGAKSEDECVAPPGYYLPEGTQLTAAQKEIKECPLGTYKETWQRIGISGCQPCGVGDWLSDKTIFLNDLDPNTGLVRRQIGVRGSSDSCYIQRGMGAVQERNQTTGEVVLRAVVCPVNYYGVVGVDVTDDSTVYFRKYGKVASPCTQCPTNMITDGSANRIEEKMIIGASDALKLTLAVEAVATGGYYSVEACFNQPGYGYTQGASQKCALGYYNAGYNKLPCTQCPYGKTTLSSSDINSAEADCTMYIAGFGDLTGIPQLCPVGTYSVLDTPIGEACEACPVSKTTADVGSDSAADCDVCAAGYGQIALNTTCQSCQNGYYGPNDREDSKCLKCPTGRTFSYDYNGVDDIFVPETTSKPYSDSQADCVADFSQIVDGAFYLDLVQTTGVFDKVPGAENLQSCVQNCRENANCTAATFDYDALQCWAWTPVSTESFVATGGVAFKLVSSTNLAASEGGLAAKEMGQGEFNFIPDGANVAKALNVATIKAQAGVTSLQACQKACSDVNLCSGIVFGQYSDPDTITSCSLIMGVSQPGSSLRTLIKANFQGLNTNLVVSAGYYSQPGTSTVSVCAKVNTQGAISHYCPGGPTPGWAPKIQCAAVVAEGTYTPEGAETANDCNSYLMPGYYWNSTAVIPCDEDFYCPGYERYEGQSTRVGRSNCPTGTNSDAQQDNIADCNTLKAGYYYTGAGAISHDNIVECDAGYYCKTEGVSIIVNNTTADGGEGSDGRNKCPVGSSSVGGKDDSVIGDCVLVQPGYEFKGTAINNTNMVTCEKDKYCPGERTISGTAAVVGDWCPEGTGVDAQANDVAGAKSANDCTILYPGYYYTGVGTDIKDTTVLPCLVDSFCLGGTIVRGAAILPQSCPAGSSKTAGTVLSVSAFHALSPKEGNGGRTIADCKTLKAGYYYSGPGAISASTVKLCTVDYYCATAGTSIDVGTATNATGGYIACEAGVGSPAGSDEATDCNILKSTYHYTGAGASPNGTNIVACPVKEWCPGGDIVTYAATGTKTGTRACPVGSTTNTTGSDAMNDCWKLDPGYYYTGAGAFSDDTVLACPVDYYCPGYGAGDPVVGAIDAAVTSAQGAIACTTGSGSDGGTTSDQLADCNLIKKGYYWDGVTNSTLSDVALWKVCDDPTKDAYCPGGSVTAGNVELMTGRTNCSSGTRTYCDVIAPGVDCVKEPDCISPP